MADPYTQAAMIAAPYAQLGQQMFQGANMREAGYQKQMLQNAQRGAFEGHANQYNAAADKLREEASGLAQRRQYQTPEFASKISATLNGLSPEIGDAIASGRIPEGITPEQVQNFNRGRGAHLVQLGATGDTNGEQMVKAFANLLTQGRVDRAIANPKQAGVIGQGVAAGNGDAILNNLGGNGVFNQFTGGQELNAVGKSSANAHNASADHQYASAGAANAQRDLTKSKIGQAQTVTMPDGTTVVSGAKPTAAQAAQSVKAQEKISDAKDVLSLLNLATPLIDVATGSYAGTGLDELGRVVGYGTDGAGNAAQLKAIEGALISKMPKMSGPQSDKDVLLYKQMAGQIGDSTIPPKTKKAAMVAIKNINDRYSGTKQVETTAEQPKQYTRTGVLNGRKVGLLADGRTVYQDTGEEAK